MTDAFWESREVLRHVLQLARARGVGPFAVLGVALARAVATIPPPVALPPIVGGRMSLNLFVALVGASGAGKGAAEATAMRGFTFTGPPAEMVPLGSGEGIARTFRPPGIKADEPNAITTAIFTAPEIDTWAALASRSGSTLSAENRKLYSGEQLGFGNAGKDTRNIVEAGSYRACQIVGVQPLRSDALLGAADGGLPQRYVWLPTSDPDAPDEPPADPGAMKIVTPAWQRQPAVGHLHVVGGERDLEVPDVATKAIRAHRLAVLREDPAVNPLDGHALLTRLKVAVGLMALEGRTIVDDTDWTLAGYVMDVSTYTRDRCQRALADRSRSANTARALATADRDEIVSDRKARRARDAIMRKLPDGKQQTKNQLRMTMKADIRDYLEPALSELLETGEITVSPAVMGNQPVHMYQRYIPEKHAMSSDDAACTESTYVPTPADVANRSQRRQRRQRERTRGRSRLEQQTTENAS